MENTGTWNSDYALLFFAALISPFFLYFLGRFLSLMMDMSAPRYIAQTQEQKIEPIKISVDFCGNCEKTKDNKPKPHKTKKKPSKAKTKAPVAKKEVKPKPKANPFESDAIGAMCDLGMKKMDAKNLVRSLCSKKEYNSIDSLIKDCFMCINKP